MDIGMLLGGIHLTDYGYTGLETLAVDQHFCPTRFQTGREAVPNPLAITVPVADKDPRHSTAPKVTMDIFLIFRIVIAVRMCIDWRMIPHESALFQSTWTCGSRRRKMAYVANAIKLSGRALIYWA
jgi:hypothetical protein